MLSEKPQALKCRSALALRRLNLEVADAGIGPVIHTDEFAFLTKHLGDPNDGAKLFVCSPFKLL